MAYRAISGRRPSPLCELASKSLGVLELSVLPSIDEAAWVPTVHDADALLLWGGDPLFLANWMRRSGLTGLLPTLRSEAVYVGVSAGSIAAAATFVETYVEPPERYRRTAEVGAHRLHHARRATSTDSWSRHRARDSSTSR